jgi:hypothetical protein
MRISITKKLRLNAVQILSIGFALVILTGAILLTLPISSQTGTWTPFYGLSIHIYIGSLRNGVSNS